MLSSSRKPYLSRCAQVFCKACCRIGKSLASVYHGQTVRMCWACEELNKQPKPLTAKLPVSVPAVLPTDVTTRAVSRLRTPASSFATELSLETLPRKLLFAVLSYLDVGSLSSCQPSRKFRELLSSDQLQVVDLWQSLALQQAMWLSRYAVMSGAKNLGSHQAFVFPLL
jgi:hypothetical protein